MAAALAVPAFAQEVPSDVVGTVVLGNTTIVFVRGTAGLNLDELRAFDKVVSDDPSVWAGHSRQTGDTAFHYDCLLERGGFETSVSR